MGFSEGSKYYYLNGILGPWIQKASGTGRVLKHLLKNEGLSVPLEEIAKISRWKNPRKKMREYLEIVINNWSPYEVTRLVDDENVVYYQLDKKRNN